MIFMDNEDGTWNVEFDDGSEGDIPAQLLEKEAPLREMPTGVRIVLEPQSEPKPDGWTRFVCFSDTHGMHDSIKPAHMPPADVLLHAGDFTNTGELEQVESFAKWLEVYPARHKVVIAGNHDVTFHDQYYVQKGAARFHSHSPYDCRKARPLLKESIYLEDSAAEVCGYTIFGSPWQPEFCDWAFNLPAGEECRRKWSEIPGSVDILMTHGPPSGYGDQCSSGKHAGCEELRAAIEQRAISVNVSGHIHDAYGCAADGVTLYVNASTCTSGYRPTNRPIVFDLPPPAQLRSATKRLAEERLRQP